MLTHRERRLAPGRPAALPSSRPPSSPGGPTRAVSAPALRPPCSSWSRDGPAQGSRASLPSSGTATCNRPLGVPSRLLLGVLRSAPAPGLPRLLLLCSLRDSHGPERASLHRLGEPQGHARRPRLPSSSPVLLRLPRVLPARLSRPHPSRPGRTSRCLSVLLRPGGGSSPYNPVPLS